MYVPTYYKRDIRVYTNLVPWEFKLRQCFLMYNANILKIFLKIFIISAHGYSRGKVVVMANKLVMIAPVSEAKVEVLWHFYSGPKPHRGNVWVGGFVFEFDTVDCGSHPISYQEAMLVSFIHYYNQTSPNLNHRV